MRQAQQLSSQESSPEKKRIRKLSLRQEHSNSFEDLLTSEDLRTLGDYIQSNIHSKRKNIMQLYSTTLSFLHHSENSNYAEDILSPTLRMEGRKKSNQDFLQPLTPQLKQKRTKVQLEDRGNSLIVSNKFPAKVVRKPRIFLERLGRLTPKKLPLSQYKSIEQKEKKVADRIEGKRSELPVVLNAKSKSIKKKKGGGGQQAANEINPWQYLVIPQDPYYFNL